MGNALKAWLYCNHTRQHHSIKEEPILKTRQCPREENVLQSSHVIRCWTLTSLHPTVITFIHSLTNSITVTSETTRREGTRDKGLSSNITGGECNETSALKRRCSVRERHVSFSLRTSSLVCFLLLSLLFCCIPQSRLSFKLINGQHRCEGGN